MAGTSRDEASSSRSKCRSSSSGHTAAGNRGESVVIDCARRRSSCGYCKLRNPSSIAHGLLAQSLTVDDYQDLLDRGWRRSGCFLYKPEMERTCCPSYTIRLKVANFVPSKEQKRVSKRMQRYLDGTLEVKKHDEHSSNPRTSQVSCSSSFHEVSSSQSVDLLAEKKEDKNKTDQLLQYLSDEIDKVVKTCIESGDFPSNVPLPKASVKEVSQGRKKKLVRGPEDLLYTTNIAFQIASALRHAETAKRDEEKLILSGPSKEETAKSLELSPKVIGEKLAALVSHVGKTAGLLVKACNGHINFYSAIGDASGDKGNEIFHFSEEPPSRYRNKRTTSLEFVGFSQRKRRKLEIRLEKSSFDREEYELYKRYQIKVHNDAPEKVSESSYRMFLVDTPLTFVSSTDDNKVPPCGFGSFHQRYTIDGQLVAVGVVDILPRCLSSKYLFWDPDLAFLSLGKYSALQEINWVAENQKNCPSLQYYYLGYYIHSCSKMRYKAAYYPSDLLCPLRYKWVPFTVSKPLLDRKKYVVLSDYVKENGEPLPPSDSDNAMVFVLDESEHIDSNDLMHHDEEMGESDYDEGLEPETSETEPIQMEDDQIDEVAISLRGSRFRYKDLKRAFHHLSARIDLEAQLKRYIRVVGAELSKRVAYSLD